jgi:hypothetical protein
MIPVTLYIQIWQRKDADYEESACDPKALGKLK